MCHTPPRGPTPDESMLLAAVLAFLEGLWRATRSVHPMQVWRVERWLRDHRSTIAQFRAFLTREKAVQHSIEDSLDGRVKIPGRPVFLLYATGIELWSWPARARSRFREDTQEPGAPDSGDQSIRVYLPLCCRRRREPIPPSNQTNTPMRANSPPAIPAITPITGNIFLWEMK